MSAVLLTLISVLLAVQAAAAQDLNTNARIGHIEGQGVTQYRSVTPIELFPYVRAGDSLFFADLRGYFTNSFELGGNAGLGWRYYDPGFDRVFGASVWYDGDNSRDTLFHQVGVSLESFAYPLDVRTNIYIPVGTTTQDVSREVLGGSVRFQGNHIVYSESRSWFTAMTGIDAELGVPIPGQFADEHILRVYGGGYHFTGDEVEDISGVSARVSANIIAGLDAQVQVTYDDFYSTRVFGGISWTFGALHHSKLSQKTAEGRLGEHVNRNYTVVAPGRHSVETQAAINPATGMAYTVAHVSSSAAPGGTGNVDSPFATIADGQAAGTSIVFVHAGSEFHGTDATVVFQNGQRIFGEAADLHHFLAVPEGWLLVPHVSAGGNRPVLEGAPGNAVTLANSTQFAGFTILNAGGDAVVGDGLRDVAIDNVTIINAAQAGARMTNSNGAVRFANLAVLDSGAGLVLNGGPGTYTFRGTTTFDDVLGASASITNLGAAGSVSFDDLVINNRHGRGLEMDGVTGSVKVGTLTIANQLASTESALDIRNSPGQFTFNKSTITGTTGAPGINLQNNLGATSFGPLTLTSHDGTAFKADTAGALHINGAVNGAVDTSLNGTISAVNGTAVDIQSTALNVNLRSLSSSNAAVGLRLVNTTGTFGVFGDGSAGSGGTITGATQAMFLQNTAVTGLNAMTIANNGTGIRVENSHQLFVHNSEIRNNTLLGIDALNTTQILVDNSLFIANGSTNIRTEASQVRAYTVQISNSTLTTATGENVAFRTLAGGEGSSLNLTFEDNAVTNTLANSRALIVGWNGTLATEIDESTFDMGGGSTTAVFIQNASTAGPTDIVLTNSAFLGRNGTDTAFHSITAGQADLIVGGNEIHLTGTNSTGLRMSLASSSSVTIEENVINDFADGGTGILFDSIKGPGSVEIEDNELNFADLGGLLDRGIIFTAIDSTGGTVQLSGNENNTVFQADTNFAAPLGTTTGRIRVNGALVP